MNIYMIKKSKDRRIEESILLIAKAKDRLKKSKIAKKILNHFGLSEDIIAGMSISFDDDLDVTAKTVNGVITLNDILLDKSFSTLMRYIIHEMVHVCQHVKNQKKKPKKVSKDKYLENSEEVEAFKWQVLYETDEKGEKSTDKYLEDLMDFHKIPKKKRKSKIKELKDYLE